MANYTFVYSVDAVTVSGRIDGCCMILDHPELHEFINDVKRRQGHIIGVEVVMYDAIGEPVNNRDLTHMFVTHE